MKALADLEPRFVVAQGRRVGVSFACPACGVHRVSVNVDPPFDAGRPAAHPHQRTGESFADLTLTPSVVAYRRDRFGNARECWHGHITAGVCS